VLKAIVEFGANAKESGAPISVKQSPSHSKKHGMVLLLLEAAKHTDHGDGFVQA
jgi:hypothetical protein